MPASNAFGLPYPVGNGNPPAACQGESLKPFRRSRRLRPERKMYEWRFMSREAYLRQLISGVDPRDAQPPDYYSMMREIHKIGNNLNQIAQKAHTLNVIDVQRYDKDMRKFGETVRLITEAVILPEQRGTPQNLFCGEKEQSHSDKPFTCQGKGDKRRGL